MESERQMDEMPWTIYRCSPVLTLYLSDKLVEAGVEVYVPEITMRRRIPRTRTYEPRRIAVMPSFAFIRGWAPVSFDVASKLSYMNVNGRVAKVADSEVNEMRALIAEREAVMAARAKLSRVERRGVIPPQFSVGETVVISSGPFKGHTGEITLVERYHITIDSKRLLGSMRVSPFILSRIGSKSGE